MRIVVVGGGIAGLTAADALVDRLGTQAEVVVLEATDRVGGKLRGETVGGVQVDVGAEAMLNRRPEGVALARKAGLSLVHPTPAGSRVFSYGALRPLPRSLMGVPLDVAGLAQSGVLSEAGLARALAEPEVPATVIGDDISVGDLVAARFGDEVSDRLVEPLLGGVYAGHAHAISTRAAAPQLLALAAQGSMLRAAAALGAQNPSAEPIFAGVAGGMYRLPQALAGSGRFEVRTQVVVRELHRQGSGFRLVTGPVPAGAELRADAVVVAAPAHPSARLLDEVAPEAARLLADFQTASVAVVTLAFRATDVLPVLGSDCSGFLVPPVEECRIKAATFSFAKWDQIARAGRGMAPGGGDLVLLRTSLGRHGQEAALQRSDRELIATSLAELARIAGLRAAPVDARVQRWGGGLPQYPVGHPAVVARIREAVAQVPGLAVAGASYDGVGVPATIASAHRAVDVLLAGTMAP